MPILSQAGASWRGEVAKTRGAVPLFIANRKASAGTPACFFMPSPHIRQGALRSKVLSYASLGSAYVRCIPLYSEDCRSSASQCPGSFTPLRLGLAYQGEGLAGSKKPLL